VTDLAGVFTYHNDAQRTGLNAKEYALSPSNVSASTFGKLFSCVLDTPGFVYAQPLYAANLMMSDGKNHNVVFVATESDWVYAFDADSAPCQLLWKTRVLKSGDTTVPAADTGEVNDLVPEIGVTSTPVIDPATGTLYVCAKAKDNSNAYHHRLYALNLSDGAPKFGSPVEITAPKFNVLFHLQRPALLLNNGVVYVAFGSHGDHNVYQGWVIAYDAATLAQKFAFATTDPTVTTGSGNQGSIWQSGNGPSADSGGNVYVETANGVFDADTGGSNYSDSVIKLSAAGSVVDFFTPADQATLSANDVDLGSSGVIVLPDSLGSAQHPHLAIATGKTGVLYLLDRDNLGKFNAGGNRSVQEVPVQPNTTQVIGGIFGQPAVFGGNLYVAAVGDALKQYGIANGAITTAPQSQSGNTFDLRGATPVVSANGAANGIVWMLDISAFVNPPAASGPAVLYAYDAANLANVLYASPASGAYAAGNAVKFTVPTVANGKVYVGGQASLTVFGLFGPNVLFTDDFNRADVNPIARNWTTSFNVGGAIVGNELTGGGAGDNFIFLNSILPPPNQYAKITFVSTGNNNSDTDDGGPVVRGDASGNGYLLNVVSNDNPADSSWRLFRVDAGHGTDIDPGGKGGKIGRALRNGDVLEIRAVGNLISGYLNGIAIPGASTTDATYPTGGFGVHLFGNTGRWDDFEGGSL
jgi:hypothetical protein